jgi:hypothetical protein
VREREEKERTGREATPHLGTGEVIADTPPSASVDLKAQIRAMWR